MRKIRIKFFQIIIFITLFTFTSNIVAAEITWEDILANPTDLELNNQENIIEYTLSEKNLENS